MDLCLLGLGRICKELGLWSRFFFIVNVIFFLSILELWWKRRLCTSKFKRAVEWQSMFCCLEIHLRSKGYRTCCLGNDGFGWNYNSCQSLNFTIFSIREKSNISLFYFVPDSARRRHENSRRLNLRIRSKRWKVIIAWLRYINKNLYSKHPFKNAISL